MISLKSKLVNATLAATFVIPLATAGIFTSAGSAQAVTLNGSIGLSGKSVIPSDGINPKNTSIKFNTVHVDDTYDDFAAFLPSLNSGISINTLNLTKLANLPAVGTTTSATYSTGVYTPFIDFGWRTLGSTFAHLTFNLDDSVVTRTRKSATGISDSLLDLMGKFYFNGQTIATGTLNASLSGASSTYQLTLVAEAVPEPTTILGLGAVGAVMAMSRRRKSVIQ
ncbi:PEP-CTERM sorting domain-containing protein [uncultured Nostoc sp.]|uniref:PEP-CTERM sorting domain-containing protein n=1 Tax=uncultured Nostoc sp. TaxID=340711 RepID=UPI0035C9D6D5